MDILKRNVDFGTKKSFTIGTMTEFINGLNDVDRAAARRIDAINSQHEYKSMTVRTKYDGGTWSIPQLWINNSGVVTNESITNMLIENAVPINAPWDPTWTISGGATISNVINKAKCIIPAYESGTDPKGSLVIAIKDDFGDMVTADLCITLRNVLSTEPINAVADPESVRKLPDGTDFYNHWYIDVPTGVSITPEEIYDELVTVTSFASFFNLFYIAHSTAAYLDTSSGDKNFAFIKHSLTLNLSGSVVSALYAKLTHIFDDLFTPSSEGNTRSVSIVLPTAKNTDGAITDISRYMLGNGKISVEPSMLKYEWELHGNNGGSASGYNNIVTFATRADKNTVILCDGTRIYKDRLAPNFAFASESSGYLRDFYLTGCAYGVFSPSVLAYDEGAVQASLAVWSSLGYGYYEASTKLHDSVSEEELAAMRRTDKEAVTYFSYQFMADPDPTNIKPLFSIDRWKGYVCVGGGKQVGTTNPTVSFTPPRNLEGVDVVSGVADPTLTYPWADSLLGIVAPKHDTANTRAGIMFSRAWSSANQVDNAHASYIMQNFATDNLTASDPSIFDGLFLVTRSRKAMLGASPEGYNSTADLCDGASWRSSISVFGGESKTYATPPTITEDYLGKVASRVLTGETFGDRKDLPKVYSTMYGNTIPRDSELDGAIVTGGTSEEEGLYYTRLCTTGEIGSSDFDVPKADHMNIMMWTRKDATDHSVMKFVHKYGVNGPNKNEGYPDRDLPGETGLRVGYRDYLAGLSTKHPCAELTALAEPSTGDIHGRTKFVPKVMTAVFDNEGSYSSIAFCGLTTDSSPTQCVGMGEGLSVVNAPFGGGSLILKHLTELLIKGSDCNLTMNSSRVTLQKGEATANPILEIRATSAQLKGIDYATFLEFNSHNASLSAEDYLTIDSGGDMAFTSDAKMTLTATGVFKTVAPSLSLEIDDYKQLSITDTGSYLKNTGARIGVVPAGGGDGAGFAFVSADATHGLSWRIHHSLGGPRPTTMTLSLQKVKVTVPDEPGTKWIWAFVEEI